MYNIKIYGRPWINLYKVLSPKKIESNYAFSETVDFGQQEFTFSYYWGRFVENSIEWTVDLFKNRNIVEVYQDWILIYTWWVVSIIEKEDKKWYRFDIKISWLASLLSKVVYSGSLSITNPTTAILQCISEVNTKLGLNIDVTKVQTYTNPYNWKIKNARNCVDVLSQAMEKTKDRYFFINEQREAIFQPYTSWASEELIFWEEVSAISVETDTTLLINKVYIKWRFTTRTEIRAEDPDNPWSFINVWVDDILIWDVIVEDAVSIAANWLLETEIYLEQEVDSNSAATEYWEDYLSKQTIQEFNLIRLEKPKQWEWLHPGDNITVRNSEILIRNDIIKKIVYDKDGAVIETKDYESLEQFLETNTA